VQIGQFIGFATVSLMLALIPGPSWVYVISTTIGRDRRTGLIAVLGNATGIACHVLAVAAGLSAVLSYSANFFHAVKWVGAIYLIYLGIQTMWQAADTASSLPEAPPRPTLRVFGHGVLVNLLNPKVALVMLALLPQFVNPTAGLVPAQIVLIGLVHAVIASIVLVAVVLGASEANRRLSSAPRWIRIFRTIAGLTLVAVGMRLAFSRIS